MIPFPKDTLQEKVKDLDTHPILLLLALSKTWNWVAERRLFQNNDGYLKLAFSDLPQGGGSMSQVEKKLRKLRIERRPYPRLPRGSRGVAGREGCPGLSGALAHRVTPESIRGSSVSLGVTKSTKQQGGKTWQPFVGGKNGHENFC